MQPLEKALADCSAGRSDKRAIFAIQHKKDNAEVGGWNPELNFVYSSNMFESSEIALDQGNNFAIVGRYLFVARWPSHPLTSYSLQPTA